jgi:hypothetical protein
VSMDLLTAMFQYKLFPIVRQQVSSKMSITAQGRKSMNLLTPINRINLLLERINGCICQVFQKILGIYIW